LAEKLGSIVAQASRGTLKKISIAGFGDEVVSSMELLRAGVLKGILSHVLQEPVNFINAPFLADEMGLSVSEQRDKDGENFNSLLRVRYETSEEAKEVAGTVYRPSTIRLVRMDGFRLEVRPEGSLLIYTNLDRPGMLAKVGAILAKHDVNIAGVSLGRTEIGKNALTVMSIDNEIPPTAWKELQNQEGISDIRLVQLDV
jgi:D-3-phosphoglycerate dehydrogenase